MPTRIATDDKGKRILEKIRNVKPFVQASFSITKKRCGNPLCRCVKDGPLHESALLTWKEKGRTRTLYVPLEFRKEVSQWVEEGRRLKTLIAQMSRIQCEFLVRTKAKSKKR